MIITVTWNPAIDRTLHISRCRLGDVHRVEETFEDIGGKGINVAKVVQLFGEETLALGFAGGANGEKIFKYLGEQQIPEDFIRISEDTRINIKVYDKEQLLTTEFNEKGPKIKEDDIEKLKEKIREKVTNNNQKPSFIVFSGSTSKDFSLETYYQIIKEASQYAKVVVDAEGKWLIKGLEAGAYLIKPNIHELESTFSVTLNTKEKVIELGQKLIQEYGTSLILVSMGKDGSMLITENHAYEANPLTVEAKSTVGAGDSMLGGFLYGLTANKTFEEAFRYGAASGTAAVTTQGTQLFDMKVFKSLLDQVVINQIQ